MNQRNVWPNAMAFMPEPMPSSEASSARGVQLAFDLAVGPFGKEAGRFRSEGSRLAMLSVNRDTHLHEGGVDVRDTHPQIHSTPHSSNQGSNPYRDTHPHDAAIAEGSNPILHNPFVLRAEVAFAMMEAIERFEEEGTWTS